MSRSFSLGVRKIWDELAVMQAPGFYWVNIERQVDANLFCQQLIRSQPENTRAALICSGQKPESLLNNIAHSGPSKLPLFTLPAQKNALKYLTHDLMRSLRPQQRLFILFAPANLWQTFTSEEMQRWLQHIQQWLEAQNCTLLVICHSTGINKIKNQLVSQHRYLQGLADLQWQQDNAQYVVSWWSTAKGVTANQLVLLEADDQGWSMADEIQQALPQSRNDEHLYLAETSILEGAPPLSTHWQLLESNTSLAQRAMTAHAATLIFALNQSEQIDKMAHQIHNIRRQRGNTVKIVVREMHASLRYSDERLLLACGANLIVPHVAPLSRFLTMLEGIQGQRFSRHVPEDINALLEALRPLQLKGYLPPTEFYQSVLQLMNNTLLPENGKGVLVALRAVPGLQARQALTLCHLRRYGDVVTVSDNRLLLFLSTCRINDLDTALSHIFRLPVAEAFSNRLVWYQDQEIISEMNRMMNTPEAWQSTGDKKTYKQEVDVPEQAERARRTPVPLTLNTGHSQETLS
ncbi:TPA: cellulose biosynthesis protein BcsE [Yersinia enterocolitica]|uniref:Cellulose biosynthesis protein BcsE n=2 Tax=Yersinia enterocolitica TaxID=630 RepID=A0A7U0AX06_YEREN|nr:cellulose biosynthesis protein BcsE [Yersinia enterocolitica]EKN3314580.1 cellulose biosynthesis protein BcsE [Yersinia enterocolitica]EKN3318489.1 cellulose biosynthesis protein BcsE [Yersinia enterocolitica]EKN3322390.1 cellulose biosynthesis protein BcsE [Yersinia enterocolitica]EKN3334406.1 cellulose biosynthesis protein BcsE [Yersinia enterocolitica]EKN3354311.1 cellulose biosynthesis protein BcsE [Yersinia enterocolitica]